MGEEKRNIVKMLVIPNKEGEKVGDNWPLMVLGKLGKNDDWDDVLIVTDGVHASAYGNYPEISVEEMAKICVDAINAAIHSRLKSR